MALSLNAFNNFSSFMSFFSFNFFGHCRKNLQSNGFCRSGSIIFLRSFKWNCCWRWVSITSALMWRRSKKRRTTTKLYSDLKKNVIKINKTTQIFIKTTLKMTKEKSTLAIQLRVLFVVNLNFEVPLKKTLNLFN